MKVALLCLLCVVPALAAIQACNEETLARSNPAFGGASKWTELSDETEFRRFRLANVAASAPALDAAVSGRGVVMHITSAVDVTSAYAAVAALRATGNKMPVQVYHTNLLTAGAETEFAALEGVSVHSIEEHSSAVLASSFAEVLAISPRTFAVADPASLFESSEYQATGVIAFPSLYKTAPSNPIWSMLNKACVDQHEQTAAAFVVNKAKAWNALHVAEHLSSGFFSSMLNEKDNALAFGAMTTGAAITMAPASQAVAATYTVDGAKKVCAHSMMLKSLSGSNLFMVSANPQVIMSGSNVETINCFDNVDAVAQDDAFVASVVRLQAAVPEDSSAFITQACPADTVTQAGYNALVGIGGAFYTYSRTVPGSTGSYIDLSFPRAVFTNNCGGFWKCAGGSAITSTVAPTVFWNVSTSTYSANIRVSTPSMSKDGTTFIQAGNETYVRVIDPTGLRDECNAAWVSPFTGTTDISVRHNIALGSYAIIAVAWEQIGCVICSQNNAITVRVEYMGPSSSAMSSAIASIPMMVAAAFVAFVAQRWF